jgi:hypothetical protein
MTDQELLKCLRQYRSNDGDSLVFGYDKKMIDKLFDHLESTPQHINAIKALAEISSMCVGELAMGYKLDAQAIGQLIYEATGLTQPQLQEAAEQLEKGEE